MTRTICLNISAAFGDLLVLALVKKPNYFELSFFEFAFNVQYTQFACMHATACLCESDPLRAVMHSLLRQTVGKHKQNALCMPAAGSWHRRSR